MQPHKPLVLFWHTRPCAQGTSSVAPVGCCVIVENINNAFFVIAFRHDAGAALAFHAVGASANVLHAVNAFFAAERGEPRVTAGKSAALCIASRHRGFRGMTAIRFPPNHIIVAYMLGVGTLTDLVHVTEHAIGTIIILKHYRIDIRFITAHVTAT